MKIALIANTDWYLFNYKLAFAAELRRRGHHVTLVSPSGEHSRLLLEHGFSWKPLFISRKGMNPLLECVTVLKLSLLYRAEKFDLVHHFTIKPVLYGSLAAKLAHIHHVVNSFTGLGYMFSATSRHVRLMQGFLIGLLRFALRGTRVIFQNPEHMDYFLSKRVVTSEHSSLILGSGVDPDQFAYTPEPEGTPIVLMAARLIWEKGVREFVSTAATLNERGKVRARYVLVGQPDPGNPSSVAANLLEEWQAQEIVEWWGWQPNMPEILSSANVVCLPSSYGEGLPRVLLEAASVGRPIVAADIPGCREIVRDGENGYLVPAGDEDALANAIESLLSDPQLRRKMGRAGRELVLEKFSLEQINAQTLALYPKE